MKRDAFTALKYYLPYGTILYSYELEMVSAVVGNKYKLYALRQWINALKMLELLVFKLSPAL